MAKDVNADIEGLVRLLRELPASIREKSGRVLYSPVQTLAGTSPVYFLGINPGESPLGSDAHSRLTIDEDIERIEKDQICEHAYLDESWRGSPAGGAKMQRYAQMVFAIMAGGMEAGKRLLRQTPTSNVILLRSRAESDLKSIDGLSEWEIAWRCWAFHQEVIRIARPEVVLIHGVGRVKNMSKQIGLKNVQTRPSGWGKTMLYTWELPSGPRVLAIPNLSRYAPDGPRMPYLRAFFAEFGPSLREHTERKDSSARS